MGEDDDDVMSWLGPDEAGGYEQRPGAAAFEDGADDVTHNPPVVATGDEVVGSALAGGAVVAVPGVGGYCLAVRVGTPGAEARLEALAADPDGPHYAVGHRDDVRALTSGWNDEVERLLERCWPGPVDVFLPRASAAASAAAGAGASDDAAAGDAAGDDPGSTGDAGEVPLFDAEAQAEAEAHDEANAEPAAVESPVVPGDADAGGWAVTVGMPDGRAMRRLCREHGPWRTIPLNFNEAAEVARAFRVADVAVVVDGGRCDGDLPTLVDATVTPVRVLREGALPSNFIDATMAMGARKRWFSRSRAKES